MAQTCAVTVDCCGSLICLANICSTPPLGAGGEGSGVAGAGGIGESNAGGMSAGGGAGESNAGGANGTGGVIGTGGLTGTAGATPFGGRSGSAGGSSVAGGGGLGGSSGAPGLGGGKGSGGATGVAGSIGTSGTGGTTAAPISTQWQVQIMTPTWVCTGAMALVLQPSPPGPVAASGSWTCAESAYDCKLRQLYVSTDPCVSYSGPVTGTVTPDLAIHLSLMTDPQHFLPMTGTLGDTSIVGSVMFSNLTAPFVAVLR